MKHGRNKKEQRKANKRNKSQKAGHVLLLILPPFPFIKVRSLSPSHGSQVEQQPGRERERHQHRRESNPSPQSTPSVLGPLPHSLAPSTLLRSPHALPPPPVTHPHGLRPRPPRRRPHTRPPASPTQARPGGAARGRWHRQGRAAWPCPGRRCGGGREADPEGEAVPVVALRRRGPPRRQLRQQGAWGAGRRRLARLALCRRWRGHRRLDPAPRRLIREDRQGTRAPSPRPGSLAFCIPH
jgi:hypothetical protein